MLNSPTSPRITVPGDFLRQRAVTISNVGVHRQGLLLRRYSLRTYGELFERQTLQTISSLYEIDIKGFLFLFF